MNNNYVYTLCWDCSKACGDCSWSRKHNPVPVNGWVATPKKIYSSKIRLSQSYIVHSCPLFDRDAVDAGAKWINRRNKKE